MINPTTPCRSSNVSQMTQLPAQSNIPDSRHGRHPILACFLCGNDVFPPTHRPFELYNPFDKTSACASFLGESNVSLPRRSPHLLQAQKQWPCLESVALGPRPVRGEARISAAYHEEKQKDLGKEPGPASTTCLGLGLELVPRVRLAGAAGSRAAV